MKWRARWRRAPDRRRHYYGDDEHDYAYVVRRLDRDGWLANIYDGPTAPDGFRLLKEAKAWVERNMTGSTGNE